MLYATTRNNLDAYTPYRVLREDRGPTGGFYVPFHLPQFSQDEIKAFCEKSFNAGVADILNLLFNTKISSFDVDFAVGRHPVRLHQLGQKILIGECWHNPDWEFSRMADSLSGLLQKNVERISRASEWASIAVRIAVLFGIFGEFFQSGIADTENKVDISVVSGNFSAPVAAWYARAMGLPVGTIICCCNENNAVWELFRYGTLKTDGISIKTALSEADVVVPFGLERFIYAIGDCSESERFAEICRAGGMYRIGDRLLKELQRGMYVTVSSQSRIAATVANLYKSKGFVLSPYAALAYSGVQDYRSGTGEWKNTLILSDRSPILDSEFVSSVLGIPGGEIRRYI